MAPFRAGSNWVSRFLVAGGIILCLSLASSVNGVNSPPICSEVLYRLRVPQGTPVDTVILTLNCSGAGMNDTLRYSDYADTSGFVYLNINGTGSISLLQQIPLDITNLTYGVYAKNSGNLVTNVTVLIEVVSDSVPICSPTNLTFTFNDRANYMDCVTKQLSCQYATKRILYYAVNNESVLFFVYGSANGAIKVCPSAASFVGRNEQYTLSVNVSTQTDVYIYNASILIVGNRSPSFDRSLYNFTAWETLTGGSLVAQVVIGTNLPVTKETNVIYVIDPDMDAAYGLNMAGISLREVNRTSFNNNMYLPGTGSINFTSLNFSVANNGQLIAGDRYVFVLTAVDSGGLSATATVLITVISFNGTPTCDSSLNITVPLTLPVGTKVANLLCYFSYGNPPYDFTTNPAFMQEFWSLSQATGAITLAAPLPVNTSRVEFNVITGRTIIVNIDQWFPPNCASSYVFANIPDFDVSVSCGFEITCVDTAGRGQNMSARLVAGSSGLSLVQNATLGGLKVGACVDRSSTDLSMMKLGNHWMFVVVSSDTGSTNLTFNITVLDLNQPPYFQYQNYSTRVREDVANGTLVASVGTQVRNAPIMVPEGVVFIRVDDADLSTSKYGLANVTYSQRVEFDNGTVLDHGPFGPAVPDTYIQSITVLSSHLLRPDAVYFVFLTVTDHRGLNGTATLTVNVEDVNQPPICLPKVQSIDLDLITVVGSHVFSLACTDDDHNTTLRSLSYNMYMENDSAYFNVFRNGSVILTAAVPRDVTLLRLKAYAVDGLGLIDNVTIIFNVTGDYSPVCDIVYQPPTGVWDNGTCFAILPNCSDPSAPGNSRNLRFTFTGNWTADFRDTTGPVNISAPVFRFCYTLSQDGLYEIGLNVTNGLGVTTWRQVVHVVYLRAYPTFTSNSYVVNVSETAPVGSSLVTPTALVNNRTVPLVYRMSGIGGDNRSHFLSINSSTGLITVARSLRPLTEQQFDFLVTAVDPSSNFSGITMISLYVYDLDEPPTCTNVTLRSRWALSVGEGVGAVNCSDLDVSSGYTNLSYTIRATSEVAIWSLVNGSVVVLANRSQLVKNLPKSVFELTVDVTNNNFSVTTFVTIALNLTIASPLTLSIVNISGSDATLLWTLDDLYRPLIANFTFAVNESGKTHMSDTVVSNSSLYVLTGLTPGVQYTAQLRANGIPGVVSVSSTPVMFQTQVYKQSFVEIQILNMAWDPRLNDNQSPEYSNLTSQIMVAIEPALRFRLKNELVSVKIRSFRAGSVKAEVVVITNQLTPDLNVHNNLTAIVRSGSLGGLVLNSSYVIFSQALEVREESVTYTSPLDIRLDTGLKAVVEGTDVTATCSARTVGDSTPTFAWKLDGYPLTNSSYYRVTGPALVNATTDSYRFYSSLVLHRISRLQSGDLTCSISAGNVSSASVNVILNVISALFVTLTPDPSPFVTSGHSLSFNCKRSAGYAANWTATLYHYDVSGLVYYDSQVSKSGTDSNLASFQNISVTRNTTFVCRVDDSYANMTSANVSILAVDNSRGTCKEEDPWPSIPAGQTVDIPCPEGYNISGKQYRTCLSEKEWSPVNTTMCVRQDIVNLLNKVDLIKNGALTTAATSEVGKTLNNITSQYGTFLVGDLVKSVDILNRVATIINDNILPISTQNLENYIKSADNLMHAGEIWMDQLPSAFGLINAVDLMSKGASMGLNSSETRPITTNKIVVVVGRSEGNLANIQFPMSSQAAYYPDWVNKSKSSVFLANEALPPGVINVSYSVAMYNNLSNVFGGPLQNQSNSGQQNENTINSPIIALSVAVDTPLRQNVILKFEHITTNFSETLCQFLDFNGSQTARWSGKGCHRVIAESNSTVTVCTCDHLTNFAVLMSPYRPSGTILDVLNTFTIVGCAVSIFFLVITLIIYCILWEYLTDERNIISTIRSKILVNLCIILIIAYVTFLAGVNSVKDSNGCTAVAAILHYVWLVAFFLMLSEGIDIFTSINYVFPPKRSIFIWLMAMAYGVPAIIVAVSLGVTRLDGYGGKESCWLSVDKGVLWAFVGPALATLLANFIFVAKVINVLLKSKTMKDKSIDQQTKAIVKAICVMSPVLGLTWVFGVMGVNEETLVFQVLFVIFNSLQGLLIFIFHCLLAKQVRDGLKKKWKKYQTSKFDYSSSGNNSSSAMSSQKVTSESSLSENDVVKSVMTSSPFLPSDNPPMERPVFHAGSPSRQRINMLAHDQPIKGAHLQDPLAHTGAMGHSQTRSTFTNNMFIDKDKEGRPVHVTDVGLNITVDSTS